MPASDGLARRVLEAGRRCSLTTSVLGEWARLGTPKLGQMGLTRDRLDELATKAQKAGSTKGNAVALSTDEIAAIAQAAL